VIYYKKIKKTYHKRGQHRPARKGGLDFGSWKPSHPTVRAVSAEAEVVHVV